MREEDAPGYKNVILRYITACPLVLYWQLYEQAYGSLDYQEEDRLWSKLLEVKDKWRGKEGEKKGGRDEREGRRRGRKEGGKEEGVRKRGMRERERGREGGRKG